MGTLGIIPLSAIRWHVIGGRIGVHTIGGGIELSFFVLRLARFVSGSRVGRIGIIPLRIALRVTISGSNEIIPLRNGVIQFRSGVIPLHNEVIPLHNGGHPAS